MTEILPRVFVNLFLLIDYNIIVKLYYFNWLILKNVYINSFLIWTIDNEKFNEIDMNPDQKI